MKKPLYYLYILQIIVLLPSILYWLESRSWSLSNLGIYSVFPLLGLIAFSMMWLHLMVAALKKLRPEMFDYGQYYKVTSNIVLALIVLHPALLFYKSIDLGVSPFDYAGDMGRIFIVFGSLAFATFMIYEVVDRLREQPVIKNNWEFVVAMNRIGFILVFFHGLQLGQHLQSGWLQLVWIFFGATTAIYFVWAYAREIRLPRN